MAVLEVHHLKKIYTTRLGGARVQALTDVNFSVEKGEYVAIMGESGSGKTTLLNILASLDRPSSGEVLLNGTRLSAIPESRLAAWRREKLGFVFQDFNLLDTFSIKDNIFLPLVLAKTPVAEMKKRLTPLAEMLGISGILEKYPYEVSGVFEEINRKGQTILMVTHSIKAASHAGRVLFIKDGTVFHQIYRGELQREAMYQKISDTLTLLTTGGNSHE